MNRLILLLTLSLVVTGCQRSRWPAPAPQGVTVSSGGELIEDRQNPWWVRNTTVARYCIDLDESSISTTRTRIRFAIGKALDYWKQEFTRRITGTAEAETWDRAAHYLGVGSQSFAEIACDGSEDLRFQFGYGTLSQSQRQYLKEPERYAASTQRTSYDEESLHGKGYIFINSDIGEHRFGAAGKVVERPWRYHTYLYSILLHELGHVFGIPHFGDVLDIMSARYPEIVLSQGSVTPDPDFLPPTAPFFLPTLDKKECHPLSGGDFAQAFFELPETANCVQLAMDPSRTRIEVSTPKEPGRDEQIIGTIQDLRLAANAHLAVPFWVPPGQKVFRLPPETDYIAGPAVLDLSGTGTFRAMSGAERPVSLQLAATALSSPRILGAMDNQLKDLIGPIYFTIHAPGD